MSSLYINLQKGERSTGKLQNLKKIFGIIGATLLMLLMFVSLSPASPGPTEFAFPRPDHIKMVCIDNPATTLAAVQAGDIAMMTGIIRKEDLQFFENHPETYDIAQTPGFHCCYIGINCRDVKPDSSGVYYPYHYSPGDTNYPLNVTAVRMAFQFLTRKTPYFMGIYGGIVEEAYSLVPPQMGYWHWDECEPFIYDPPTAKAYLETAACWKFDSGIYVPDPNKWDPGDACPAYPADYIPLRPLYFLYPAASIAPTSAQLCDLICNEATHGWNYWLNTWAGTSGVNYVEGEGVEYTPLILTPYYNRDHDFYFLCYGLSPPPTLMYWVFHPDNDVVGGDCSYGLDDPTLNYYLERFMFWKDPITGDPLTETEVKESLWQCQNLTMNAGNPACLAPSIQIYHRRYTDAYRKDLVENWIESPGYGSSAYQAIMPWSFAHTHPVGHQTGGTVKWLNEGEPETIHPADVYWVYEVTVTNRIYDAGYVRQPLNATIGGETVTHALEPWVIIDWSSDPWSNTAMEVDDGMVCHYRMRQDVTWQDGSPVTADDYAWDLNFIEWCRFPGLAGTWLELVYAEPVDDYSVNIYLNRTGDWWLTGFMGTPTFQRDVWEDVCYPHLWYQPDPNPTLAQQKALAWFPHEHLHPNGNPDNWPYDWDLTAEAGIGPFVFKEWRSLVTPVTVDLYRNPNYWIDAPIMAAVNAPTRVDPGTDVSYEVILQNVDKYDHTYSVEVKFDDVIVSGAPTSGFLEKFWYTKTSPFNTGSLDVGEHHITVKVTDQDTGLICFYDHVIYSTIKEDANEDFFVDMMDLYKCALSYGSYPGHPDWDYRYDINDDFWIDMMDLYLIAIKYGEVI